MYEGTEQKKIPKQQFVIFSNKNHFNFVEGKKTIYVHFCVGNLVGKTWQTKEITTKKSRIRWRSQEIKIRKKM